jgi:VWFA-related protein
MTKSGKIIHGLQADDFVLEDDGVPQQIHLDETPDAESMSLVVAVQLGGSAYLHFATEEPEKRSTGFEIRKPKKQRAGSLTGLGPLVEEFVGESNSEVAVVTFDNTINLFQNFTEDVAGVGTKLRQLKGSGRGGAVLLDAVAYSLKLLEQHAKGHREVVLLISEQRDHGSSISVDELVKRITLSNVLIYSVSFSPVEAEAKRDLTEGNPQAGGGLDLLRIIGLASDAMHKNAAKAVAELGGGESVGFKDKGSFDRDLMALSNHMRSRYLLSFQPKDPKPGPHVVKIRLRAPQNDALVLARDRYWAAGPEPQ